MGYTDQTVEEAREAVKAARRAWLAAWTQEPIHYYPGTNIEAPRKGKPYDARAVTNASKALEAADAALEQAVRREAEDAARLDEADSCEEHAREAVREALAIPDDSDLFTIALEDERVKESRAELHKWISAVSLNRPEVYQRGIHHANTLAIRLASVFPALLARVREMHQQVADALGWDTTEGGVEGVNWTSALHQIRLGVAREAEHTRLVEAAQGALEVLENDYAPCEDDCDCVLHPLRAALAEEAE